MQSTTPCPPWTPLALWTTLPKHFQGSLTRLTLLMRTRRISAMQDHLARFCYYYARQDIATSLVLIPSSPHWYVQSSHQIGNWVIKYETLRIGCSWYFRGADIDLKQRMISCSLSHGGGSPCCSLLCLASAASKAFTTSSVLPLPLLPPVVLPAILTACSAAAASLDDSSTPACASPSQPHSLTCHHVQSFFFFFFFATTSGPLPPSLPACMWELLSWLQQQHAEHEVVDALHMTMSSCHCAGKIDSPPEAN